MLNYLGAGISIVALLVAGYRARAPIRRSVGTASARLSFHKNQLEKSSQIQSLPPKPVLGTHMEHTKQIGTPQPKHQQPIETSQLQKEIKLTQKPAHRPSSISALPSSMVQSGKPNTSKNLDSECLTCANLLKCTYRQKRAIELRSQGENCTPCRYAAELSSKNA
jgi:hypothetical protein